VWRSIEGCRRWCLRPVRPHSVQCSIGGLQSDAKCGTENDRERVAREQSRECNSTDRHASAVKRLPASSSCPPASVRGLAPLHRHRGTAQQRGRARTRVDWLVQRTTTLARRSQQSSVPDIQAHAPQAQQSGGVRDWSTDDCALERRVLKDGGRRSQLARHKRRCEQVIQIHAVTFY
jgi:hypothetical protein